MAAKSKVSQPRFVDSWTPYQAWFSSVTDGNRGKADVVATSWQQAFRSSACEKEKIDKDSSWSVEEVVKSTGKKAKLTLVYAKQILVKCRKCFLSSLLEVHQRGSGVQADATKRKPTTLTERKNHNWSLWRKNEIVRAALNKKKYR